ncbi:MFS transporter [Ferrimonas marina]|uniref:Predicted arabinose efflux permease, MFS family n=1 Tax=Ferrimonas marina TaxID=299255 RepID=A0A1M5X0C8_9GAMM|nr:MFS transporter [Ferrimonas marina]SHH93072.1 Predicted arabinose efflux permease, MFS family [Ferrimonas marina]
MPTFTPQAKLLLGLTFIMSLVFATWQVLLNNFVVEVAQFDGQQIGLLQSLREVPGFLAFTAVWLLLLWREQTLALLAMAALCLGVALTGLFPSALGLYATTVLMSIGFHYYETVNQSLTLQWLPKQQTAEFLGRSLSVKAFGALLAYGLIALLMGWLEWDYAQVYLLIGTLGMGMLLALARHFPRFEGGPAQHKKLLLRRQYWLYYGLTFLSGARRQIFLVFAAFLMVERFEFSVLEITALFLFNHLFNLLCAPAIGRLIARFGEQRALLLEYSGLVLVFCGYAVVDNAAIAAGLYVIDHLLFALAIAMKSYLQKIGDPRDMAATASVSFTINHIAAVVIPALLGWLWLQSPSQVFLIGAAFAAVSLTLSMAIPRQPTPEQPVRPWLTLRSAKL